MASGANSTFRQVGIATGIAGLGSVFQSQIQHKTVDALAATPAGQAVAAHGGSQLQSAILGGGVREAAAALPTPAGRTTLLTAYHVGFSATLNTIMLIGAVIALIGSVGAFALVRQRDFVPSFTPPSGPPAGAPADPAPGAAVQGAPA
jgi:hypothetical protein